MYQPPKCPYSYFAKALKFYLRLFFSLWVSLKKSLTSFCLREFNRSMQYSFSNLKIMLCISSPLSLYRTASFQTSKKDSTFDLEDTYWLWSNDSSLEFFVAIFSLLFLNLCLLRETKFLYDAAFSYFSSDCHNVII